MNFAMVGWRAEYLGIRHCLSGGVWSLCSVFIVVCGL